jgi:hypothetical protein
VQYRNHFFKKGRREGRKKNRPGKLIWKAQVLETRAPGVTPGSQDVLKCSSKVKCPMLVWNKRDLLCAAPQDKSRTNMERAGRQV